MNDKPRLAKEMVVTQRSIEIDGEEFPWLVVEGGVSAQADNGLHTVTLTLFCERVEFRHDDRTPEQVKQDDDLWRRQQELNRERLAWETDAPVRRTQEQAPSQ